MSYNYVFACCHLVDVIEGEKEETFEELAPNKQQELLREGLLEVKNPEATKEEVVLYFVQLADYLDTKYTKGYEPNI